MLMASLFEEVIAGFLKLLKYLLAELLRHRTNILPLLLKIFQLVRSFFPVRTFLQRKGLLNEIILQFKIMLALFVQ